MKTTNTQSSNKCWRLIGPYLLITGLTTIAERPGEWASNRTLPLAHNMGYPLLMPELLLATRKMPRG